MYRAHPWCHGRKPVLRPFLLRRPRKHHQPAVRSFVLLHAAARPDICFQEISSAVVESSFACTPWHDTHSRAHICCGCGRKGGCYLCRCQCSGIMSGGSMFATNLSTILGLFAVRALFNVVMIMWFHNGIILAFHVQLHCSWPLRS